MPAAQLALKHGLLDQVQVDIVEALLAPDDVVPGFEILDLIGQGGMGVVFRAQAEEPRPRRGDQDHPRQPDA